MRAWLCSMVFILGIFILPCSAAAGQTAGPDTYDTPRSTVIYWTDGPRLKAVNITFFPDHAAPLGIVSVPLYVCLPGEPESLRVDEFYSRYGREKLTGRLEELFNTPIETYVSVDQQTLYAASQVIGTFEMGGTQTTLADVFEGRYVDHPVNLQVEIRQLAGAVTTPAMLVKLPRVIWVFATQVDTNIGPAQVLDFYRLLKDRGPGVLQKKAVPGHDIRVENRKYRLVHPEVWNKTMLEVTTPP